MTAVNDEGKFNYHVRSYMDYRVRQMYYQALRHAEETLLKVYVVIFIAAVLPDGLTVEIVVIFVPVFKTIVTL